MLNAYTGIILSHKISQPTVAINKQYNIMNNDS